METQQMSFSYSVQGKQALTVEHLLITIITLKQNFVLHQIFACNKKWTIYDSQKRKRHWTIFGFISLAIKLDIHKKRLIL